MKQLLLTAFFAFTQLLALAQSDNPGMGARAVSMGNASVANRDSWALFNNVGALSGVEELTANFAFDVRYGITEFKTYGFGVVMPFKFGGVGGLSFSRFGDKVYSEQKIGLGYSHKINFMSIGGKIDFVQVAIDDQIGYIQGSRTAFAFEIGGVADITKKLAFGMHAYNVNQGKLKSEYSEGDKLPVILKAGISYKPISKLFINAEIEKDIDYDPSVKMGVDFQIVKNVNLRTGINTKPFNNYFGIGFTPKKFSFDYALATNTDLGFSHHLSLGYKFK